MPPTPDESTSGGQKIKQLSLFALAVAPLYLNDFVFIGTTTAEQWLVADYLFRILVLVVVFSVPTLRDCVRRSIGTLKNRHEPAGMAAVRLGVLAFLACTLMAGIELYVRLPLLEAFPGTELFRYPRIENANLIWFDLLFGWILTATSEEIVCRAIAKKTIATFSERATVILIVSSVVFALAHWSHGLPNVAANFLTGLILMGIYLHTRSIVPSIVAHYAIGIWSNYPVYLMN